MVRLNLQVTKSNLEVTKQGFSHLQVTKSNLEV